MGVHARHWRALSHRSGSAGLPSCPRSGLLRSLLGSLAQSVCTRQRQARFQKKSQKKDTESSNCLIGRSFTFG
ncbi:hypothetical protein ALP60_101677 [Pseudomonas savastanoi]|uniref:Uncharacterized protein n=1 Tax=Pseudomonas savastanoi TaxID=29438 RepID=A0A3M5G561_PSESS|nr:hypothetical protein ALP60_101677 [Pseudomonas savastanoi]